MSQCLSLLERSVGYEEGGEVVLTQRAFVSGDARSSCSPLEHLLSSSYPSTPCLILSCNCEFGPPLGCWMLSGCHAHLPSNVFHRYTHREGGEGEKEEERERLGCLSPLLLSCH